MIRIALIGCGTHAQQEHAAPLQMLAAEGRVELVAACDLDEKKRTRVCEQYGFARGFGDIDEMLDVARPDGCVVVMPVPLIAPIAERLLRRGVRCTVEKPPADSIDKVRSLAAVAHETATPHQVSLNRRFNPYINQAIAWAAEQGPQVYVRTSMFRSGRREPEFIWSTGIHCIDATRHIGGEIRSYGNRVIQAPHLNNTWHDAVVEFASGAWGSLHILPTCGHLLETYEIFGENYHAVVHIGTGLRYDRLQCWKRNELVLDRSPGDEPHCVRTGAYDEMAAFIAALQGERPMRPTLQDALPSAEIGFDLAAQQDAEALT